MQKKISNLPFKGTPEQEAKLNEVIAANKHDGIRAAYVEFVEKLNAAYGEGVAYFLVGGMMTNSTNNAMQEAVAILQAKGINASFVALPGRSGYTSGHPMVYDHEAAAKTLYDAIVQSYFG